MLLWLLLTFGVMTVLVRLGLAVLTAGSVRRADVPDVLLRAAVDAAAAVVAFWAVGAPLLFGSGRVLAWNGDLFLNPSKDSADLAAGEAYAWAVAMVGGAVVGGAIAGRGKARVGVVASAVLGGVVFPVIGHWVWAPTGWLRVGNAVDYGGAMAVHLPAAVFAAVAAVLVGPRLGRYDVGGVREPVPPHSLPLVAVGVGLTIVGWMPYLLGGVIAHPTDFNPIEVPAMALVATNTVLAAAGGLAGGLGYARVRRSRRGDRSGLLCGVAGLLGGLVAISAGPVSTGTVGAVLVGVMAGVLVPVAAVVLDRRVRLDDPTGLVAVHGVGAVWGILAAGAFAGNQAINRVAQARLLAVQGVGLAASLALATVAAAVTFGLLRATGSLRRTAADEPAGLATATAGVDAYRD